MSARISAFKQKLVYRGHAPLSVVRSDLREIARIDQTKERLQSRYTWGAVGSAVGGLVILFVGSELQGAASMVATVLGVAGLVGCVALVIVAWYHSRLNYENRRYQLVSRVLDLIGHDVSAGDRLGLELDLRPMKQDDKLAGQAEIRGWKTKFYVDEWCVLQGRFADGTSFVLRLTEKMQHKSRWKTNARGKMKHKSKSKCSSAAMLSLKFKAERYPHVDEMGADAQQAVKLPAYCSIKRLDFDARSASLSVCTKEDWYVGSEEGDHDGATLDAERLVASMFMSLYQVLNLSRMIGKAERKGAAA